MDDLFERLRQLTIHEPNDEVVFALGDAADRIRSLEAEVAELRAEIERWQDAAQYEGDK